MLDSSLAMSMRRGVVPDYVKPNRSRFEFKFGVHNDLSRTVPFQKNKGQDSSLNVLFTPHRVKAVDQPVGRELGVDSEALLDAQQGIKVRLGGETDSEGKPKLPKTIEGIKSAIDELKAEQIVNSEQALSIAQMAHADMGDALVTIMNILAAGSAPPQQLKI